MIRLTTEIPTIETLRRNGTDEAEISSVSLAKLEAIGRARVHTRRFDFFVSGCDF